MSKALHVACVLLMLTAASGGCNEQNGSFILGRRNKSVPSDIFKVVCFYPPNMWRSFDQAGDRNIEGFTFILYLISAATDRGAVADGVIQVQLFDVVSKDEIQTSRKLVYEWSSPMSDIPQRNPTKLGHGYQPSIDWGTFDLFGKELEVLVRYIAPNGSSVPSRTATIHVPPRVL
ncbi:MAG: hypothetical protein GXP29_05425 [Planctomycetes bacterium]|nr:hypothetical protein [Planctomycetota bacterium]